jgi:hypothetical protein
MSMGCSSHPVNLGRTHTCLCRCLDVFLLFRGGGIPLAPPPNKSAIQPRLRCTRNPTQLIGPTYWTQERTWANLWAMLAGRMPPPPTHTGKNANLKLNRLTLVCFMTTHRYDNSLVGWQFATWRWMSRRWWWHLWCWYDWKYLRHQLPGPRQW